MHANVNSAPKRGERTRDVMPSFPIAKDTILAVREYLLIKPRMIRLSFGRFAVVTILQISPPSFLSVRRSRINFVSGGVLMES